MVANLVFVFARGKPRAHAFYRHAAGPICNLPRNRPVAALL